MNPRASALRALLLDYVPADEIEESHRDSMLRLLAESDDPFSRDHFIPGHFTASAFVLAPAGEDLLLIDHRRLERWLQPGGHIDPGDVDPLAAAVREAGEETGAGPFTVAHPGIFDLDVHPIPPREPEPAHLHFDVRYLLRAAGRTLAPDAEVAGARWVGRDDVPGLTSDGSVRRAVAKLGSA